MSWSWQNTSLQDRITLYFPQVIITCPSLPASPLFLPLSHDLAHLSLLPLLKQKIYAHERKKLSHRPGWSGFLLITGFSASRKSQFLKDILKIWKVPGLKFEFIVPGCQGCQVNYYRVTCIVTVVCKWTMSILSLFCTQIFLFICQQRSSEKSSSFVKTTDWTSAFCINAHKKSDWAQCIMGDEGNSIAPFLCFLDSTDLKERKINEKVTTPM